jgi:hypothetical protein
VKVFRKWFFTGGREDAERAVALSRPQTAARADQRATHCGQQGQKKLNARLPANDPQRLRSPVVVARVSPITSPEPRPYTLIISRIA